MCSRYRRLGRLDLVTGVAVVRNATQDRDRECWLVSVVCEAVPFAFRDEDEVAFLQPDGLALGQVEACAFEDEENTRRRPDGGEARASTGRDSVTLNTAVCVRRWSRSASR
jgi:hypothetical protein